MEWELIGRLLLAGVLGAVIGLDREYRAKEAGFRTHFLVSLGSALFMVVSQYGFRDFMGGGSTPIDPSRVAAQIVSGIGFLGAGTIIFQKQLIRGLTTAAGMWATAGIGMAIGGGMYWIGVAATALTLAGMELLTVLFKDVALHNMSLTFSTTDRQNLARVMDEVCKKKCPIISYSTQQEQHGELTVYKVSMFIKLHHRRDVQALFTFIQSLPQITLTSIE